MFYINIKQSRLVLSCGADHARFKRKCRLWDRVWRCYSWKENCQSRWQSIDGRYVQYTSMGKIWYICHMFVYAVWGWKERVIKASRQILWFLGFFHTRQLSPTNCNNVPKRPALFSHCTTALIMGFSGLKRVEVFWTTFIDWILKYDWVWTAWFGPKCVLLVPHP